MEPQQSKEANASTKEKRSSFFNGDYKINRWPAETSQPQDQQPTTLRAAQTPSEGGEPGEFPVESMAQLVVLNQKTEHLKQY